MTRMKARAVLAAAAILITTGQAAYGQGAAKKDAEPSTARQQADARAALEVELLRFCEKANPRHHGIKVVTRKAGAGFGMYCQHSFFSKYSLDYGALNPALQKFLDPARTKRFLEANVQRIGVVSADNPSSMAWLELR